MSSTTTKRIWSPAAARATTRPGGSWWTGSDSRVYAIAYHFTMKREDAEELSQEIFLKVFENLHRYDGGFPLVAWILSVSRNLCIDRYRRRKREKSFRFVSDEAVDVAAEVRRRSGEHGPQEGAHEAALLGARRDPRGPRRDPRSCATSNGLAYDEIGKALDLPDGTVKSRLFRARAEVARKIRERHESPGARERARVAGDRRGGARMSCRELERLFVAGSPRSEQRAHRDGCPACARLGADARQHGARSTSGLHGPGMQPGAPPVAPRDPAHDGLLRGRRDAARGGARGRDLATNDRRRLDSPPLPLRRLYARRPACSSRCATSRARAAALARDAARRGASPRRRNPFWRRRVLRNTLVIAYAYAAAILVMVLGLNPTAVVEQDELREPRREHAERRHGRARAPSATGSARSRRRPRARSRSGRATSAATAAPPSPTRSRSCGGPNRRRRRAVRVSAKTAARHRRAATFRPRAAATGNLCPPDFVSKSDDRSRRGEKR